MMPGENGNGPADRSQISFQVPYAAALGLVLLILFYERRARRRERGLLSKIEHDREVVIRAGQRQQEAEDQREAIDRMRADAAEGLRECIAERDARVSLPTDALAVSTVQGLLCCNGLDHPAGSKAGIGGAQLCDTCNAFLNHYDQSGLQRAEPVRHPGQ